MSAANSKSDRTQLEDALLRIEKAAKDALYVTIDTPEGQELGDALRHLDALRASIRNRLSREASRV